jgi:Holliday junction resolvase
MRRFARIDANQKQIVADLRSLGASVVSLAPLGNGVPDILVACRGKLWLFEIKNPKQKKSDRALTTDEKRFHLVWSGYVDIIETIDDAMKIMGVI